MPIPLDTPPIPLEREPQFDLLGLGAVAVDDLMYVDAFPPPDSKIQVLREERHCGGLTATALVAAARLGARCAYAGALGNDDLSAFAIQRLARENIDLTHLLRTPGASPVHSFIVVDSTRQTRNIFCNLLKTVGADKNWPAPEVIRAAKVLFVDHIGVAGMLRAAKIARAAGIPIVGDLERDTGPEFSELLGLVDHLIVSCEFARKWTLHANAAEAAVALWNEHRKTVVVTYGIDGCWYCAPGAPEQPVHHPAFRVPSIDTTGCGDVFHGAYAAALAQQRSLPDRIRIAAAAAALKTTQPGGQSGIPDARAIELFLNSAPAYAIPS